MEKYSLPRRIDRIHLASSFRFVGTYPGIYATLGPAIMKAADASQESQYFRIKAGHLKSSSRSISSILVPGNGVASNKSSSKPTILFARRAKKQKPRVETSFFICYLTINSNLNFRHATCQVRCVCLAIPCSSNGTLLYSTLEFANSIKSAHRAR